MTLDLVFYLLCLVCMNDEGPPVNNGWAIIMVALGSLQELDCKHEYCAKVQYQPHPVWGVVDTGLLCEMFSLSQKEINIGNPLHKTYITCYRAELINKFFHSSFYKIFVAYVTDD